ncbi:uncharacterized protein F4822DRAFT_431931 [Hypoxylon trugodes]|uniref:uncharacterized protein n=1 Tax=Hypoxylon trugodes TaxID=326681 RepID=UPI00218CBD7A|nr:uncharacterized protein F4822DRAFT_431931 [Hypoxylon trugodes]KAI1387064.1 hypothetical protein F4822DRAFT_431931 [Hypoxylon trugodes]
MCHDWKQEYFECGHVSRKLINCPAYFEQQDSAVNFLSSLFRGRFRNKKHCGRVIPHHAGPEPFCPSCTIKFERMRAQQASDGTFRAYRPDMENVGQGPSKVCLNMRTDMATRRPQDQERHSQHVIKTRSHVPENYGLARSLWVPDLHDHPETFVRRETCGRPAEPAPPVSSSRRHKSSAPSKSSREQETGDNDSKSHASSLNKHHGHVYNTSPGGAPNLNDPQLFENPRKPPKGPQPTYYSQHHRKVGTNELPRRPALKPSPRPAPPPPPPSVAPPQVSQQNTIARSQDRQRAPTYKPPVPMSLNSAEAHPKLRRKAGQFFSKAQKEPTAVKAMNAPPPMYLTYLTAYEFTKDGSSPHNQTGTNASLFLPPRKKKKSKSSKLKPGGSFLSRIIKFGVPIEESEESFACQDSRMLSRMNQGQTSPQPQ